MAIKEDVDSLLKEALEVLFGQRASILSTHRMKDGSLHVIWRRVGSLTWEEAVVGDKADIIALPGDVQRHVLTEMS